MTGWKVCYLRLREPDKEVGPGKHEGGCVQGYTWFAHKTWVVLWIIVNGEKWLEGIGVTEALTTMARYELYISDAVWPTLTWISALLNGFVVLFVVYVIPWECVNICREERNVNSRRVECWSADAVKAEGAVQTRATPWQQVWYWWLWPHERP